MNTKKQNNEIREALEAHGLHVWELSDAWGVAESTVYRWLRRQMPPEVIKQRLTQIENYIKQKQ